MNKNNSEELNLIACAQVNPLERFLKIARPIWAAHPESREPIERNQPPASLEPPKFL